MQDREGFKQGMKWGFFGGGIEKGETPEEALVREVNEELELELKPSTYTFHGSFPSTTPESSVERFVYLVQYKKEMYLRQHEGTGLHWFSPKDALLLKSFSETDKRIVKSFVKQFEL